MIIINVYFKLKNIMLASKIKNLHLTLFIKAIKVVFSFNIKEITILLKP